MPYTIVYEIQECSSVKTITKTGVLPEKKIQVVLYTEKRPINEFNIKTGIQIQGTDYNTNYTKVNVCLAIITYSLGKEGVLINLQERAEDFKCCTNCHGDNQLE